MIDRFTEKAREAIGLAIEDPDIRSHFSNCEVSGSATDIAILSK